MTARNKLAPNATLPNLPLIIPGSSPRIYLSP